MTMHIDATLRALWTPTDDHWSFTMPTGWMQGRTVFGGLTGAVVAALGRRVEEDPERALRVTNLQLLAPVTPGVVEGTAELLREGRNITFVAIRLRQQGELVATASLVFAKNVSADHDIAGPPRPNTPKPEALTPLPYIEGVTPQFTQNVDMRWAEGAPPFSGSTSAAFTGLFRYRVPVGDAEGVLALLDTWPAPSLSLASRPIPASTVAWTAHIVGLPPENAEWFTMRYETIVGAGGLHTVTGWLYADDTVIAWTEQLAAIFG